MTSIRNKYDKALKRLESHPSLRSQKDIPHFMKIKEGTVLFKQEQDPIIKIIDLYVFELDNEIVEEKWRKLKKIIDTKELSANDCEQVQKFLIKYQPPKDPQTEKRETTLYLDVYFDFERQEFWKKNNNQKQTIKTSFRSGRKTYYNSFQILLKNKGKWMPIDKLIELDQSGNQIKSVSMLRRYLAKNLIPKLGIPSKCLQLSSKEDRLRLIEEEELIV